MSEETYPVEPVEEAPEQTPGASSVNEPQYVTKADLQEFARELAASLQPQQRHPEPEPEDDDPYATEIEQRVSKSVAALLETTLAPLIQQQALQALGGDAVSEYIEGLSPADLRAVAKHPGLSKALRDAAAAKTAPQRTAPRSQAAYVDDNPGLSAAEEREIAKAFPAYQAQFPGLTIAEFRKLVRGG